jgi:hypothetical protein
MTDTKPMAIYWLVWFLTSITFFLVPEFIAIFSGHVENTLSYSVWRMEKLIPGQSPTQWTFAHFAFIGFFTLLAVWLIGHFGWGDWA